MSKSKQTRRRLAAPAKKKKSVQRATQDLGFIAKALRGLGGLGGSTVGAMIGAPQAGATVGHGLGAALSRWLGTGDYSVHQNSIVQRASTSVPNMHKNDQTVVVRHREYVGPLAGSTTFQVAYELPINPGLSSTFPWLSGIAVNFQEYKIKGMVYHYVPTSGMAISGTNSALGSVMMQTSYRATETAPTSKNEILNEYWANEVVPSDTMAHPIECDPKENPFAVHYVRSTGIPGGELLLYDMGKTFIATQGMQGSNVVGDIWVTYEIELKKPMVNSAAVNNVYASLKYSGGANSSLFGAGVPVSTLGSLPITAGAANIVTIPKGQSGLYTVAVEIQSTSGLTTSAGLYWGATDDTLTNCEYTLRSAAGGGLLERYKTTCQLSAAGAIVNNTTYICNVRKVDPNVVATITINQPLISSGTYSWVNLVVTARPLD